MRNYRKIGRNCAKKTTQFLIHASGSVTKKTRKKMELKEGTKLKLLAIQCKTKLGISHEQFADMIGITPPHLSHVFRRERITEEIKQKAITAFNLSPDYFDRKGGALFDPQSSDAKRELDEYRALVVELKNQVREWREKWEDVRQKLLETQEQYLKHLNKSDKSE